MKNLVDRLTLAWHQLTRRERLMLGIGGASLIALALYLGLWEPLARADAARASQLAAERALATRIDQAAGLLSAGGTGATDRKTSLLAAVDRSSREAVLGKEPSRIQPEGDDTVKVWIDGVGFDNLLRWLGSLQQRYGIRASSAEIERSDVAGQVNARLSLGRS